MPKQDLGNSSIKNATYQIQVNPYEIFFHLYQMYYFSFLPAAMIFERNNLVTGDVLFFLRN